MNRAVGKQLRILHYGLCAACLLFGGACNLADPIPAYGDTWSSGADGVAPGDTRGANSDSGGRGDSRTDPSPRDTSKADTEDRGVGEPTDVDGGTTGASDSGEVDSETDVDALPDGCSTAETCNGEDDDCDGTIDEGCSCTFDPTEDDRRDTDDSHEDGVCTGQTLDSEGVCRKPSEFEESESSCSDGVDNDCDGASDLGDLDCKKPAGSSCSDSAECLGRCESFSGATGNVCTHRIFVTSGESTGDLGGISGGDQTCNRLAAAQNLGGTWRAILSSPNVHAKDRISLVGQLYSLDGARIANNESDLWDGDLDAAIDRDESNNARAALVWTGTLPNGKWDGSDGEDTPDDCGGDWTSTSGSEDGEVGYSADASDNWTHDGDGVSQLPCDKKAALYCVDGQ